MENKKDSRYYDAKKANCFGLLAGVAKKKADNQPIHALEAQKFDGPFYCPECLSEAIVRHCIKRRDHFAHKARLSPIYQKGETELHLQCKHEICNILKSIFPEGNWAVERPILENKEKYLSAVTPDISGRIDRIPVIIEIQTSILPLRTIIKRTEQYTKRECAILWIVPLKVPLGDTPFRPRQFERYLHSMYYGRTYYWQKGDGTVVTPVHYGRTERYIEESHWFEEDGTERSEGGYYKAYRTIKTPVYGQRIDIAKNFELKFREEFVPENEDKKVPKCIIYKDKLSHWWKKDEVT